MADVADAATLALRLCEYATVHDDGTYTIVRGGIESLNVNELPLEAVVWALLELPPGTVTTASKLPLSAELSGPTGIKIFEIKGEIDIQRPFASTKVAFPVEVSVQSYGPCILVVAVAGQRTQVTLAVTPLVKPGEKE